MYKRSDNKTDILFIDGTVSWSYAPLFVRWVGRLVDLVLGRSGGRSVGLALGRSCGRSVGLVLGRSGGRSVGQVDGRSPGRSLVSSSPLPLSLPLHRIPSSAFAPPCPM